MNIEQFIEEVKQVMNDADLYKKHEIEFIGADTTQLEYHIDKVFVDSWKTAFNTKSADGYYITPRELFVKQDFSKNKIHPDTQQGIGCIELPNTYYDLHSFRMRGWGMPVVQTLPQTDSLYRQQSNEFSRAKWIRPLCFETSRPILSIGGEKVITKVLEYYSLPKGEEHEVSEAIFYPVIDELKNGVNQNEKLIRGLVYLCGGQIYNIQGKTEIAAILRQTAFEILER